MALLVQEKTIGTNRYEVTQLNALKGRGVFTRFAKLLAPVLEGLASASSGKVDKEEAFAKALVGIISSVSDEDMNYFCEAFAPSTCLVVEGSDGKTRRPGLKDLFGLHFASNYTEMLEWLYFCLEVNFGSFFVVAGLQRATSGTPAESK